MTRKQKVLKLSAEGFGECYEQAAKHLQPMRIKQESERRYPIREIPPLLTGHYNELRAQKMAMDDNSKSKLRIEGFEQGALYEQSLQLEKSKKLVEALKDIIIKALADFEGEKEGE